jgi:hypothetical protein
MKYCPTYRCVLCGELVDFCDPIELEESCLHDLSAFILNSKTQMTEHITHKCKDGSTGVAYFAGFRKEVCG